MNRVLTGGVGVSCSLCFIVGVDANQGNDVEIRTALASPDNVLVVIADPQARPLVPRAGKMAVFPSSGVASVDGNRVTVKAGTYVIADMNEVENPKKEANQLLAKWKGRKGDNVVVVQEGGKMMAYTFFIGELKEDRTFEISKVVAATKSK